MVLWFIISYFLSVFLYTNICTSTSFSFFCLLPRTFTFIPLPSLLSLLFQFCFFVSYPSPSLLFFFTLSLRFSRLSCLALSPSPLTFTLLSFPRSPHTQPRSGISRWICEVTYEARLSGALRGRGGGGWGGGHTRGRRRKARRRRM